MGSITYLFSELNKSIRILFLPKEQSKQTLKFKYENIFDIIGLMITTVLMYSCITLNPNKCLLQTKKKIKALDDNRHVDEVAKSDYVSFMILFLKTSITLC